MCSEDYAPHLHRRSHCYVARRPVEGTWRGHPWLPPVNGCKPDSCMTSPAGRHSMNHGAARPRVKVRFTAATRLPMVGFSSRSVMIAPQQWWHACSSSWMLRLRARSRSRWPGSLRPSRWTSGSGNYVTSTSPSNHSHPWRKSAQRVWRIPMPAEQYASYATPLTPWAVQWSISIPPR